MMFHKMPLDGADSIQKFRIYVNFYINAHRRGFLLRYAQKLSTGIELYQMKKKEKKMELANRLFTLAPSIKPNKMRINGGIFKIIVSSSIHNKLF